MKKYSFIMIMAVGAIVLCSCGKGEPKADFKDQIDSVSYAVGQMNAQDLRMYITQQGVDSVYIDDVIEGLVEGFQSADNKKKAARNMGVGIGQQLDQMFNGISMQLFAGDSTRTMSRDNFIAGIVAACKGTPAIMSQPRLENILNGIQKEAADKNLKEGQQFLAANAKKPGVKTTESGLQYKVIKQGKGHVASDTMQVRLHYEGRTIDGKVFDSTYKNHDGQPLVMQPRQFIKGFSEALTTMPVGSTWEVYIPTELGYGDQMVKNIKPNSVIIFKIELISIVSEEKK